MTTSASASFGTWLWYYQWPRDSTAEDIADAFDLSAPTVHYRLRKAHQTVVGSLLEDRTAPEDP
ncbi:hypothetical protein BRC92_10810 [Halobacteriales archaeon QS_4_69_31]|nr:MAG: hypothetical protein BRC92_10810 [Halobacteriales archaeon QS_4_69_31]